MIVSLIVAMDERGGIGRGGRLPWRLSADLRRFKALTWGHHLIVGRKTCEAIGRPLPGRKTILVTRKPGYVQAGCAIAHSLKEALDIARVSGESEVFIAGGGEIFSQALPLADRIYLTRVHTEIEADVFFPSFEPDHWIAQEAAHQPADEKNQYPCTFFVLDKSPLSLIIPSTSSLKDCEEDE